MLFLLNEKNALMFILHMKDIQNMLED